MVVPRLIFLGLLIVLAAYQAFTWFAGYPAYRDHHVGAARIFAEEGISIQNCQIVGFNANQMPTVQEIPAWQAGAAFFIRLLGGSELGANLFSLSCFLLSLWPLFQISKRCLGLQGAWWCLIAYLAQPVVFDFAGCASTDGLAMTASLWAYEILWRFSRQGGFALGLGAVICCAFAALMKLPFFMAAGIALAAGLAMEKDFRPKLWARLVGVGLVTGCVFFLWTRYTDSLLAQAEWPFVDLRISHNPEMIYWYFGDLAYRLSPATWIKAAWRIGNSNFGSFFLIPVIIGGFCLVRNREGRAWLIGFIATTLVFAHLVLHHSHYFLMLAPACALALGGVLALVEKQFFSSPNCFRGLAYVGVFVGLTGSLFQGMIGREVVGQFDPYFKQVAEVVAQHTVPTDRLLVVGGGWGGDILQRSRRSGLSIWDTKNLDEPAWYQEAISKGFNKVVIILDSPLLVALQKTNPGMATFERKSFEHFLSPAARGLRVVFKDENVLILSLPKT